MEGSLHAKDELDSSSRFDTKLACDGETDTRTHNDTMATGTIASRGKKGLSYRHQRPKVHKGLFIAGHR